MAQTPLAPLPALNLDNIQGDILGGMPKKTETYFFFQITDPALFRKHLVQFIPLVTTVSDVLKDRKAIEHHKRHGHESLLNIVGAIIAFSHKGFVTLGIDDSNLGLQNQDFIDGQKAEAEALGDKGTGTGEHFVPNWDPAFLEDIHGVIDIAGDSHLTVHHKLCQIKLIFGIGTFHPSIKEVTNIVGDVRPGKEAGHEHFGFLDGISNPTVIGFDTKPLPGPRPVQPGILLLGQEGDSDRSTRPAWAIDGSFLVIRYLSQLVPEFDTFLRNNPVPLPGLTPEEGSELLGARLVGRWKSGAPIDLAPFRDDPSLAKDPQRINNFQYSAEASIQKICPFAAHTRKTNPRADLIDKGFDIDTRRIMRRGIQFGPELSLIEKAERKTLKDRGLIFACYQANIANGFAFIQKSWANRQDFPPQTPQLPGLDPIIGQGDRSAVTGIDPSDPTKLLSLPEWVVSKGGEYFFSPSLKALKETLSAA